MTWSIGRRFCATAVAAILAVSILGGCSTGTTTSLVGKADGIVTISGSITGRDAVLLEKSWTGWEKANRISIRYSGSKNFEEKVATAAQDGRAPDLAIFEQPGLVSDLASLGYIKPVPAEVRSNVAKGWTAGWALHGVYRGTMYAAPLLSTVNGYIWYSPKTFARYGLAVPKTWADLYAVSSALQARTGRAPWCEGFKSDATSGAAGTTWIADLVLRDGGPSLYDKWVSHAIPFSDPRIAQAFTNAGQILLNPNFVNAGIGGRGSINTTTTAQVAGALESGSCALTHQSSSFDGLLEGATTNRLVVGPNKDLWAFVLPAFTAGPPPITVGGDEVAAFSNDADTQKVQAYLSSSLWAISRLGLGGAISANRLVPPYAAKSAILSNSMELLENKSTVMRFDASDLMPAVVGSGTFLTGMVQWIGGRPTQDVVPTIDQSWPSH